MANRKSQSNEEDEFFDDIPLHKKQGFGAGLHRQKVRFVPASEAVLKTTEGPRLDARPQMRQPAADFYLSLVLKDQLSAAKEAICTTRQDRCQVCNLLLGGTSNGKDARDKTHETSVAHQFCMQHLHPPSAIDRARMGLSVLESQGWDPDAHQGLGIEGQGIRDPIKAKAKHDNSGLGAKVDRDVLRARTLPKVEKKLNAKQSRKKAEEDSKKHDALIKQLYGNPDVEKYLGN